MIDEGDSARKIIETLEKSKMWNADPVGDLRKRKDRAKLARQYEIDKSRNLRFNDTILSKSNCLQIFLPNISEYRCQIYRNTERGSNFA